MLDAMLDQVAVSGLTVQVSGHTDNVGAPAIEPRAVASVAPRP